MKFIKNEEEFLNFFSSSLYNKIIKESTIKINRKLNKKEYKNIILNLYKELKNYEYRTDVIDEKLFTYKTNNVARIIPILSVKDELLYYFVCKMLEDEIAVNRTENTYGGWRIGNKIKIEEDAEIDVEELKEKLIDVLDNICGTNNENRKFESYNKLDGKQIEEFLESLGENLDKLQFFSDVGMSKFITVNVFDNNTVNKMYYEELNKLYNQIKTKAPKLKSSFIEYVKLAINSNIYELPF